MPLSFAILRLVHRNLNITLKFKKIFQPYKVTESKRRHMPIKIEESVFDHMNNQKDVEYNAYEKDIALVHFYFETSTIFQYYRERKVTIVGFISQVGGVLGLFLGFSLVSIVELIYWFLFRLIYNITAKNSQKTEPTSDMGQQHQRYKKQHFNLYV